MNIRILCIGKLKESYWVDAVKEYSKRLSSYCSLSIEELKEEKLPEKASGAQEELVKKAEGERILARIRENSVVVVLDVKGKQLSSEALAEKIQTFALEGKSNLDFVIGGSLGHSAEILQRADFKLSFSPMTFPHQMMRVILLEQIYRSFKIIRNETYHK
ncbi:MAG: 23S rRNA (pseudouridine(1915)-N(3))-methyltransferase RlmH [Firmicutes bacterium]|nr:23S rRNA (pseudouridine(1915)-N(3))-methyltransferase RlmH [Clostridiales bacterium]MBQ9931123.1 23S rRNA (pseudouridine(1915)-N(3))-methyltransferase RlmH [Bacillota bacterium]